MPLQMYDHGILDKSTIIRRTSDGGIVCTPRVARTGIQEYLGREVGMPTRDRVRVYRSPEEVFDKKSLETYSHKTVTNDHPDKPVTPENYRDVAAGHLGEDMLRDGEYIRVPMLVMDAKAIKNVDEGKVELSVGYSTEIKWEPGTAPDGQAYDAIQTNIRVNHVAIVDAARGGKNLRIGDSTEPYATFQPPAVSDATIQKDDDMTDVVKMTTCVVDGISLQMPDTAASVVAKVVGDLQAKVAALSAKAVKDAEETAEEKKAREAEEAKKAADTAKLIEGKDAEIAALKKNVADAAVTPAKLDAMVKDRHEVFSKAKHVLGDKLIVADKSIHEVRKQVVDAKLGAAAAAYTEDQVSIAFAALTSDVKVELGAPGVLGQGVVDTARAFSHPLTPAQIGDKAKARAEADKALTERWKNGGRAA